RAAARAPASTAPAAAARVLVDAASTGALGVATTGQGAPAQKPGKPVAVTAAANGSTLATNAAQPQDANVANAANPTDTVAGPAVAGTTTGSGDADDVKGAEDHPAARAAKATTNDKDSVGARADSLAN